MSKAEWLITVLLSLFGLANALDNGLALIPPAGWLSWETFRCNVDCDKDPENCLSENLIRQMADRLVDDGFLKSGYDTVIIDDCWLAKSRDEDGRLQPDSKRFPSGMKALGEYIHSRGLQFGIYGDIGTKTCGGYPGMANNFELDAKTYAEWGVDYLKVDGCYADSSDFSELYPKLGNALNKTGRPIVYSCSWPAYLDPEDIPYQELQKSCNLWRNWVDIQDSWKSLKDIMIFWAEATLHSEEFGSIVQKGAWNDPDMLIIGNKGLAEDQSVLQMAMWAIWSAPLLMGNDLRNLTSWQKEILQTPEFIFTNKYPAGETMQGVLQKCQGGCDQIQVWWKELENSAIFIAFANLQDKDIEYPICFNALAALPSRNFESMEVREVMRQSADQYERNWSFDLSDFCIPALNQTSGRYFLWVFEEDAEPHRPFDLLPLITQ